MPPQPTPLPNPRTLLSSLLSTLSTLPLPTTTPPTIDPPSLTPAKAPLLTIHALYPTLLLPALDLLDRKLLTRLILNDNANAENTPAVHTAQEPPHAETPPDPPRNAPRQGLKQHRSIYYVQSAQAPRHSRSRYSCRTATTERYEVRPMAWSCTCAAFAFAAFNGADSGPSEWEGSGGAAGYENVNGGEEDEEMLDGSAALDAGVVEEIGDRLGWGGVMRQGGDVPLCKHLLAVVLAEWWGVAGMMVEERVIGRGEMAGWAAGWGG